LGISLFQKSGKCGLDSFRNPGFVIKYGNRSLTFFPGKREFPEFRTHPAIRPPEIFYLKIYIDFTDRSLLDYSLYHNLWSSIFRRAVLYSVISPVDVDVSDDDHLHFNFESALFLSDMGNLDLAGIGGFWKYSQ
jgi:hypothetical protein